MANTEYCAEFITKAEALAYQRAHGGVLYTNPSIAKDDPTFSPYVVYQLKSDEPVNTKAE